MENVQRRLYHCSKLTGDKQLGDFALYNDNLVDMSCCNQRGDNEQPIKTGSIITRNYNKIKIILNTLNKQQGGIFKKLMTLNADEFSCTAIDAPPGTGKTFLLKCLMSILNVPGVYTSYTNNLEYSITGFPAVDSKNIYKLTMQNTNLDLTECTTLFYSTREFNTFNEKLADVQIVAKSIKWKYKLLMVDEYGILSVWILIFLWTIAKNAGIPIIFIGDVRQQPALFSSKLYRGTNAEIVDKLSSGAVYTLSKSMRQMKDAAFADNINVITNMFGDGSRVLYMNSRLKGILKEMFRSKLSTNEDFDALYLCQYHKSATARVYRWVQHLRASGLSTSNFIVPFYDKIGRKPLPLNEVIMRGKKFIPFLVLVPSCKYIYKSPSGTEVVEFLNFKNENVVKILRENAIVDYITRKPANFFINREQRIELEEAYPDTIQISQFPLRHLILTYHSVQGQTIEFDKVDLDINCTTLNSFYVGLSRLRTLDQLNKIVDSSLNSLKDVPSRLN